ncbi:alpha/beta hydrolase fold domain-containing protein [Pseudomaricurvus sp. HS19]|uniref:alpha/beta hydrolase fold domain-containing protein n=1 Tax=Pseudomaricurvus sp. HS19 TaxID=2692626 RepID=UPI00136FDB97|nr:alpha/beta hydrolase fold domain-containing protein [Pseudomaricurvus sp. HS19]MYM61917.1 alpha/beta hydrolase fold domain-containing protein [Pseudomaricurvus sp. HS19]
MTTATRLTALNVPPHSIEAPTSISPQAQAFLGSAAERINKLGGGTEDLISATHRIQQHCADALVMLRAAASGFSGQVEEIALPSGAMLYQVTPDTATHGNAYFDIHGGGFITGGGEMCLLIAKLRAMEYGATVFAVDYRLLPDNPFPAGFNDCVDAYRIVLARTEAARLIIGGSSAGGNLAAALLLYAQDHKLHMPAGLLLLTPCLDLTLAGDSYQTNHYLDVNLVGVSEILKSYAQQEQLTAPYASPLFGAPGTQWPRTLLASGTRDLLLSDTVRMHRKLRSAGIPAELHVVEAAPHGGFVGSGAPEDLALMAECRNFVASVWQSAK